MTAEQLRTVAEIVGAESPREVTLVVRAVGLVYKYLEHVTSLEVARRVNAALAVDARIGSGGRR